MNCFDHFTLCRFRPKEGPAFYKNQKNIFFLSQCLKVPRQISGFFRFFSSLLCHFSKKKGCIPCLVSIKIKKKACSRPAKGVLSVRFTGFLDSKKCKKLTKMIKIFRKIETRIGKSEKLDPPGPPGTF